MSHFKCFFLAVDPVRGGLSPQCRIMTVKHDAFDASFSEATVFAMVCAPSVRRLTSELHVAICLWLWLGLRLWLDRSKRPCHI